MKTINLRPLSVQDYSGYTPKKRVAPVIKRKHYFLVTDRAIGGDAPKDLIRLYNYQKGQRRQKANWDLYIVKHGHKHYPNESITEYLLNRIGDVLGFNMSISQLGVIAGQIRFFSKYFLCKPNHQTLNHGADLYSGFIHDKDLIEEIEQNKLSADLFTIQFTKKTLENFFGDKSESIFLSFLEMLFFDAIVGNNDRHFYNWGVITDLRGKTDPYFAPIYDTARGLFWNDHEDKLIKMFQSKLQLNKKIESYAQNSKPKIGWEGKTKLNHFDLIALVKDLPIVHESNTFSQHLSSDKFSKVEQMIENEFKHLLTPTRTELIIKTLSYRFTILRKITNFAP